MTNRAIADAPSNPSASFHSRRGRRSNSARFMSWRDIFITPTVSLLTVVLPAAATYGLWRRFGFDFFTGAVIFYGLLIFVTVAVLALIRAIRPFRPGIYRFDRSPWTVFQWNLHSYVSITNLSVQYTNIIPPPFRKVFYRWLGGRFGPGVISIGGRISDPYLTEIEEGAMIGDDALLLGHAVVSSPDSVLILGRVTVRRGAIVGARSVIMPDVEIGENALVEACSLVRPHTRIGPGEIWSGNPAVRRSEKSSGKPRFADKGKIERPRPESV